MGLYINELLKFLGIPNFEVSSYCLNGFKDGPGLTKGRGRVKSGESEENKERDVEGDTCHVCIEREKEIFAIVNSTECSCAALQLLLLFVLAGKKKVFVYFNDSRVYRERKKNLVQFPIDSSCAALQLLLLLYWLEIFIFLFFLFMYFNDKNGLLKFWGLPNFEASSHCLNGFKNGPSLVSGLILSPLQPSPILIGSRIPLTNVLRMV